MARTRSRQRTAGNEKRVRQRSVAPEKGERKFNSLDALAAEVSEKIGPQVMYRGSALPGHVHTEFGVFLLDMALLGGLPEGQVTQIYGWEASGKTTMCMRAVANAQRKYPDKAVAFIDAEHTFDPTWARHHGIDTDNLFIVQPESGEQAVDILDAVLRADDTALVVLDSLPALVPQAEIDTSAEDSLVAKRSQLLGRACSKILAATQHARARGNNPTTLFVNQFRMKIGVVHGDPRVLPGGMQPKYLATTMVEIKRVKRHTGRDEHEIEIVSHNDHAFTIKKSKVGNSLTDGNFTMICDPGHPLGQGAIDEVGTVSTYAKRMGFITGGGTAWRLNGVDYKFGKKAQIEAFLLEDDFEFAMLKARMVAYRRQQMGLNAFPKDGYLMGMTAEELGERENLYKPRM